MYAWRLLPVVTIVGCVKYRFCAVCVLWVWLHYSCIKTQQEQRFSEGTCCMGESHAL
jgi:hypothetical protein